ncbi:type VI secretion system baseplate subunit TssF [Paraburkholderia sp. J94]|uniref:type VI secretion system baseplate subunit TssF n=1 Tax=Paraburkholderia sp. J94 TaxID=2805441 RepID=UPI002AB08C31|nr:type VI secretion system baseplate subunit TssF [Paraburkholderia sp. J94]
MDPEFPRYYQKELSYITESFCGDFAQWHVKIAARFGIQAGEITDLYLQRLIQSFAFVAAGSQMGIDRHSHEIPLAFLDGVDINYTAPLPSLGIARFFPDADGAHSAQGLVLPRGTPLTLGEAAEDQSTEDQAAGGRAECVFHTTQPVAIWPLAIARVKPTGVPADIPRLYDYLHESRDTSNVKGALRLRLATLNGTPVCRLDGLDRLAFYLCGDEAMASRLFELIHTSVIGMVMGEPDQFDAGELHGMNRPGLPQMRVEYEGLEPDDSLLRPVWPKWHGHRLVHDFFALPARFWFFALSGLAAGLKRINGPEVEIVLLLSREVATLDPPIRVEDFALFCTPIVNLFATKTGQFVLDPRKDEHPLEPVIDERTDYAIHSVDCVRGQADENAPVVTYQPLNSALHDDTRRNPSYFSLRRELDLVPDNARRYDTRQEFVQTRTHLRLLGQGRQRDSNGSTLVELDAWLTNGDLPCVLPLNGVDDLGVRDIKAVRSVVFMRGPTPPRPPLAHGRSGDAAWELMRLRFLELDVFDDEFSEKDPGGGLRDMLKPFLDAGGPDMTRFLDALVGARVRPIRDLHRWERDLQLTRGIAVTLTFDESRLDGWSAFTFALALERLVARHVSYLSFTRTTFCTTRRGEIFTWPTRTGTRGAF